MRRHVAALAVCAVATLTATPAVSSPPILPDGLWVRTTDGAEERLVRYVDFDQDADWSPDSTKIAYGGVTLVDVATGERTWVTQDNYDLDPDWSPDGQFIAFARGTSEADEGIYVVEVASGEVRRLTHGPHSRPDWSPDGTEIVFVRVKRRDPGIMVVDVATGARRTLVIDEAYKPQWSPDGEWIAYVTKDLWVIRADGTQVTNLSRRRGFDSIGDFSWSPDGGRIAFTPNTPALLIYDVDTRRRERISPELGGISNPAWAPNGNRILVDDLGSIYSIRLEDERARRVTIGRSPYWAPDGSAFAFFSNKRLR